MKSAGSARKTMTETPAYGIIIYHLSCGQIAAAERIMEIARGKRNEAEDGIVPGFEEAAADVG